MLDSGTCLYKTINLLDSFELLIVRLQIFGGEHYSINWSASKVCANCKLCRSKMQLL